MNIVSNLNNNHTQTIKSFSN